MAFSWNLQPSENINERIPQRVVMVLRESDSKNKTDGKEKNGLRHISAVGEVDLDRMQQQLRRCIQRWTSSSSRTNDDNGPLSQELMETMKDYEDVEQCLNEIEVQRKRGHRILVILMDKYATDRQLRARLKRFSKVEIIPLPSLSHHEEFCKLKGIPERLDTNAIESLDNSERQLLMELFIEEVFMKVPYSKEAEQDFIDYCKEVYQENETRLTEMNELISNYSAKTAIEWFTQSCSFFCRVVSRVMASMDIRGLFCIRFVLSDLFRQLKSLHDKQMPELSQQELVVYRGSKISEKEWNRIRQKGSLHMTRSFLSTSVDPLVAKVFSGTGNSEQGSISMILTMKIHQDQIRNSIIASIKDVSDIQDEAEMLLAPRLLFRVESVHETEENGRLSINVTLVRGEDEVKIEEHLRTKHWALITAAGSPLLGLLGLLKLIENQVQAPSTASQGLNPTQETTNPISSHTENHNFQEIELSETPANEAVASDVGQLTPNLISMDVNPLSQVSESILPSILPAETGNVVMGVNNTVLIRIVTTFTLVVVAVSLGMPLGLLPNSHSNTTGTAPLPNCQTVCRFYPLVQNVLVNYQRVVLNITCSRTLVNMSVTVIVRRNNNETHAQQYQTFWNLLTNMTYVVTPSAMIYQWYSLPRTHIVLSSFTHVIEVQFYHNAGRIRVSRNDTWSVTGTSHCGEHLAFYGTF